MPLALALVSCDVNSIVISTIAFLKSRHSQGGATWLIWSCDANSIINWTTVFLMSSWSKLCATWFFGHAMPLSLASCYINSIFNGTIAFLTLKQLKWGAITWLVLVMSFAIGASVMWYWWHHQWQHCVPCVKMLEMRCKMGFLVLWCHWHWHWHYITLSVMNGTIAFFRSRQLKWGAAWHFWSCDVPLVPVSCDADGIIDGTITFLS